MLRRIASPLITAAIAAAVAAPLAGFAPPVGRSAERAVGAGSAATYAIDATHSKALFRVKHLGASHFYGRFNEVSGALTADPESNAPERFEITIPIASVDTGNENLDNHLKSPDFFNAREFETMRFVSRDIETSGAGTYAVTGDLTIHGVTKEITATVEFVGAGQVAPQMGFRCGYETSFTIDRTEFGMDYGVSRGMLGEDVKVIVSLEGVRE